MGEGMGGGRVKSKSLLNQVTFQTIPLCWNGRHIAQYTDLDLMEN